MRLLVTRPKEDGEPLVKLLKEQGHEGVLFPLLTIISESAASKELSKYKLADIQALLVTSANGVRAFTALDRRRNLKVLAVGDASAKAAKDAGFKTVESAAGDVETLASLVKEKCDPKNGKLIHVAGSRVAGDLKGLLEKDGFDYVRVVLYRADKKTDLSDSIKDDIKNAKLDGVLLYSPRTATSFVEMLKKAKLDTNVSNMTAYALSEAVASKLKGLKFKDIVTAASPDQEALLNCLKDTKEENMTTKKEENKKPDAKAADAKVIDAKAEDVKVKDAPKADAKKEEPKKTEAKKPDVKKDDPKKASATPKVDPKKTDPKAKTEDPVKEALKPKETPAPKKKGSFKAKLLVASVVIVAAGGAAAYFTQDMWIPKAKAEIARVLKLDTPNKADEQIAALSARIEALENAPKPQAIEQAAPAPAVDVQPLLDRIATLEGTLNDVKSSLSTIEIANGSDEKLEEFKALATRLEAVEGAGSVDLSGVEAESARLSQLMTELNNRLTDVEAAKVQERSASDNVQALLASLSSLREVLRTSSAYEAELQTMTALANGDVTLEQGVEALAGSANSGIPSRSVLLTSFDGTADDIVRAVAIPEGTGWVEETFKNVTSLISIRRAPGSTEGEGALGIVARAEQNVRAGDLAGAVKELETLEGNSLEAAQGWINNVKARLGAESSLALMQSHILSMMGSAGGQG